MAAVTIDNFSIYYIKRCIKLYISEKINTQVKLRKLEKNRVNAKYVIEGSVIVSSMERSRSRARSMNLSLSAGGSRIDICECTLTRRYNSHEELRLPDRPESHGMPQVFRLTSDILGKEGLHAQ